MKSTTINGHDVSGISLFQDEQGASVRLDEVAIEQCIHSRFNTRKTRSAEQIQKLADRIRRNGFERTRAIWAVQVDDHYEVFAGGTRLEAAKLAGLTTVPVFVHDGLTDEDISRKADEDNENDEYHAPVGLLDVWAECHRLWKEEGWTQQKIAEAKGSDRTTVAQRCGWHENLPASAQKAVLDELLDEGHLVAVSAVVLDVQHFSRWLTTARAQSELVNEVLARHRGSSTGIKPTVKVVREAAKRWKALIAAAEKAYLSLPEADPQWREQFVEALARERVRSEAAVNRCLNGITESRRRAEETEAAKLRAEADAKQQEAIRLEEERKRLVYLDQVTSAVKHGDARELIQQAPSGFHLLLTDPPYGQNYQSQRRKTSARKEVIAGDELQEALALLADVLKTAHGRMADDAACLIFTGWRYEFEFRQVIVDAGFEIKGSLIWAKNNHGAGDLAGAFAPQHERIIHAVKGQPKLQQRASDVLYGKDKQDSEHPNEKPRDLLAQLIEVTTQPGQIVVDPFMGSGNTALEAFRLSREFFGCEIEERWHRQCVDALHQMAKRRWDNELAR